MNKSIFHTNPTFACLLIQFYCAILVNPSLKQKQVVLVFKSSFVKAQNDGYLVKRKHLFRS